MIKNFAFRITTKYTPSFLSSSTKEEGQSFLKMVESYFDKAGIHTGIRSDYLNFYKKPDNVLKCTYPIIRGNFFLIQKTEPLKPSLPTDANIRHTSFQPREEQDLLITSVLNKLKL
jgi:hypothetical protein